jgi:hypothetical protein
MIFHYVYYYRQRFILQMQGYFLQPAAECFTTGKLAASAFMKREQNVTMVWA